MMDQQRGKFIPVDAAAKTENPEVAIATEIQHPAVAVASRAQWNLPTLAEREVVDIVIESGTSLCLGRISVVVEKIKQNGKLFVQADAGLDEAISVGDIFVIKGVKFSVRRVNGVGQIGLKMLNAGQVTALSLPKPPPPTPVECSLENHSIFVDDADLPHPLFDQEGPTISQVRRREQKSRRDQALIELREKNKLEASAACTTPEARVEREIRTQRSVEARRLRKAQARAARKPQPIVVVKSKNKTHGVAVVAQLVEAGS